MRLLLDQVVGHPGDSLPVWFQLLQQAGIARIEAKTQVVRLAGIGFERDAVLFALPIAAGFPQVIVYLALAGALAAALAALAVVPGGDRRHSGRGHRLRPARRDGAGRSPHRHRPRCHAGSSVRHHLACHRRAGRPVAALPVVPHLERLGVVPRAVAGDLGEADQCLGRARRHDHGVCRHGIHDAAQRDGRDRPAQRAGGSRRPAAGICRRARRHQADAGARAQRARHRARGARARSARPSTTANCASCGSRTALPTRYA